MIQYLLNTKIKQFNVYEYFIIMPEILWLLVDKKQASRLHKTQCISHLVNWGLGRMSAILKKYFSIDF